MRPVNLIPPEERRDRAPIRTGPLAYMLVGVLVLGLAGVTMLVLANNKISDRKAKVAQLSQQQAAIQTRAGQLQPFVSFSQSAEARVAAIHKVANERFDWERVMRELSLVLPRDVSLTKLTATSATAATATSTTGAGTTPTLELGGCAASTNVVAAFIASLQDIDGITAVSLDNSDLSTNADSSGGTSTTGQSTSGSTANTDCGHAASFELTAEFGNAPTPAAAASGAAPTAAPTATAPTTSASTPATSSDSTAPTATPTSAGG
jgi:Tfp pilus assembly protein PilN